MPDDDKKIEGTPPPTAPDAASEIATLKAQIAELMKAKAAPTEDPDLIAKAKIQRDADDKDSGRMKRLENSITFNMKLPEFLKQNESLLTKDIPDIIKAADKEVYTDATEKTDAIKSGLIQSFFGVQANVDLLTGGQKSKLDDYLKLTKTGKQDKASEIYEMLFEPAFEMLKRTKKAEALKRGHSSGSGTDEAYKQRMINGSAKHYRLERN